MLALCLIGGQAMQSSHAAQGEELNGTLKKIKAKDGIVLGVRDSTKPFSYLNDKQDYEGYTIDLCLSIAKAIQRKLGMPQLNQSIETARTHRHGGGRWHQRRILWRTAFRPRSRFPGKDHSLSSCR